MTIVYAESSAVLTWILGEPSQDAVLAVLRDADTIVASSLTVLECARGVHRARTVDRISASDERESLALLEAASRGWHLLDVTDDVLTLARQRFPHEPVRSLDALHLASALTLQDPLGALKMLSLDDRVRRNAEALGIPIVPAS